MPRTNQDGKDIKLVLSWLRGRHISNQELAAALDLPPSSYERRKDADDYPSFEELGTLGTAFNIPPRVLQIAFGLLHLDEVILNPDEMHQYVEQGGGEAPPVFPTQPRGATTGTITRTERRRYRRPRRPDAAPH
jgi:hypothetical protein